MSEMHSRDPQKIDDILKKNSGIDVIGNVRDDQRAKAVREQDLGSEIPGLTEDIAVIGEDMALTGDPELVQSLDEATDASMQAQRELREISEDQNQ